MIDQPPEKVAQAMRLLRGNKAFETVIEWLEDELDEARDNLEVTKEDFLLRQRQGFAQALGMIIGQYVSANRIVRPKRRVG